MVRLALCLPLLGALAAPRGSLACSQQVDGTCSDPPPADGLPADGQASDAHMALPGNMLLQLDAGNRTRMAALRMLDVGAVAPERDEEPVHVTIQSQGVEDIEEVVKDVVDAINQDIGAGFPGEGHQPFGGEPFAEVVDIMRKSIAGIDQAMKRVISDINQSAASSGQFENHASGAAGNEGLGEQHLEPNLTVNQTVEYVTEIMNRSAVVGEVSAQNVQETITRVAEVINHSAAASDGHHPGINRTLNDVIDVIDRDMAVSVAHSNISQTIKVISNMIIDGLGESGACSSRCATRMIMLLLATGLALL